MLEHLYKKTFQKRLVFLVLSKCLSMLYSETKLFVSFLTPSRFEYYTDTIVININHCRIESSADVLNFYLGTTR